MVYYVLMTKMLGNGIVSQRERDQLLSLQKNKSLENVIDGKNSHDMKFKQYRFHGAFTGGFSAGYHNTVGSRDGWQPIASFASSRNNRNVQRTVQKPEDFMDEEDEALIGRRIAVSNSYDAFGSTTRQNEGQSYGDFQFLNKSFGKVILHSLGWREGDGIGPREVVGADGKRIRSDGSVLVDKCLIGCSFPPLNTKHFAQTESHYETHGLGYHSHAPASADMQSRNQQGGITTSVFESDDEEDFYTKGASSELIESKNRLQRLHKRMEEEVSHERHMTSTSITSGMKLATQKPKHMPRFQKVHELPLPSENLLQYSVDVEATLLRDKFVSATSKTDSKKPNALLATPEISITRTIDGWKPDPLLCKRFRIPQPNVVIFDSNSHTNASDEKRQKLESRDLETEESLPLLVSSEETNVLYQSIFDNPMSASQHVQDQNIAMLAPSVDDSAVVPTATIKFVSKSMPSAAQHRDTSVNDDVLDDVDLEQSGPDLMLGSKKKRDKKKKKKNKSVYT